MSHYTRLADDLREAAKLLDSAQILQVSGNEETAAEVYNAALLQVDEASKRMPDGFRWLTVEGLDCD